MTIYLLLRKLFRLKESSISWFLALWVDAASVSLYGITVGDGRDLAFMPGHDFFNRNFGYVLSSLTILLVIVMFAFIREMYLATAESSKNVGR